jgi:large subunit ribosomal protein L10
MRQEKQFLLDEVREQIDKLGSFVIMSYVGLSANAANAFRRTIAKAGGTVEVVRKRVLLKAAKEAGVQLELAMLPGHIGLVFTGKDHFETTKMIFKYTEESGTPVKIVGARFEGQLYNGEDVEALSKLPSKDEMRAQLLGTLEAPMAQTLAVIEALLTSVVYCLDNKSKEESKEQSL